MLPKDRFRASLFASLLDVLGAMGTLDQRCLEGIGSSRSGKSSECPYFDGIR